MAARGAAGDADAAAAGDADAAAVGDADATKKKTADASLGAGPFVDADAYYTGPLPPQSFAKKAAERLFFFLASRRRPTANAERRPEIASHPRPFLCRPSGPSALAVGMPRKFVKNRTKLRPMRRTGSKLRPPTRRPGPRRHFNFIHHEI